MKVSRDFYKKFTGKIKKITEKIIKPGEKFYTPPCVVRLIPERTFYYEIILEGGSALENRYDSLDSKKVEEETELVFFELWKSENLSGKNLVVGKKYNFFTAGSCWISNWQEVVE